MQTRHILILALGFLLLSKLFADAFVEIKTADEKRTFHFTLHKNHTSGIVYDDREIARTALFVLQGKGFVIDSYFDRPQFNKTNLHLTSLRPKALIIAHAISLKWYLTSNEIASLTQVPENYFERYSGLVCLLKNVFLIIALYLFYLFSTLFFPVEAALLVTILCLLFPSVYFFVGFTNMVDTLVMPLEVIFFSSLLYVFKKEIKPNTLLCFLLSLLFLVLCYLKPHHLLILGLLEITILFLIAKNYIKKYFYTFLIWINTIVCIGFLPIIYSNYKDFGSVFLSTQAGFNFFHGHNPVARGSWLGTIWEKHHNILYPMLEANKDLPFLNEKHEADFYNQLAWQWILENPIKELELIVRKTAIFFLPHNFMDWNIHPFNLFVYLGFLLYSIRYFWNFRKEDQTLLILYVPIVAIFLLNIGYFVEYRWRYYAEPFMLFFAFCYFRRQLLSLKKFNNM